MIFATEGNQSKLTLAEQ